MERRSWSWMTSSFAHVASVFRVTTSVLGLPSLLRSCWARIPCRSPQDRWCARRAPRRAGWRSRSPSCRYSLCELIGTGSARSSDRPARPGPFELASQRLQEVDQIILVLLGHLPGNARHGDGSVAFQLFIQEALDEVFVVRNRVLGRVREILESNRWHGPHHHHHAARSICAMAHCTGVRHFHLGPVQILEYDAFQVLTGAEDGFAVGREDRLVIHHRSTRHAALIAARQCAHERQHRQQESGRLPRLQRLRSCNGRRCQAKSQQYHRRCSALYGSHVASLIRTRSLPRSRASRSSWEADCNPRGAGSRSRFGRVSCIRIATTRPDANVTAATTQIAAWMLSRSAVTPASRAPTA